jgi:hypothetical protein
MRPPQPLFLARELYRRRRLMDAARALPLAGAVFFMLPLIWLAPAAPEPGPGGATGAAAGGSGTGTAGLWLFGLWIVLLGLAGVIAHRLPGAATAAAEAERRAKADAADVPP